MNINDAFPSKYLKASDLRGNAPVVVIDRVAFENIAAKGREPERKPVVYFRGKSKGLVLNKTNATRICTILGTAESERWRGRAIRLFATEVEFQGDTVEAIRVKPAELPPGSTRPAQRWTEPKHEAHPEPELLPREPDRDEWSGEAPEQPEYDTAPPTDDEVPF